MNLSQIRQESLLPGEAIREKRGPVKQKERRACMYKSSLETEVENLQSPPVNKERRKWKRQRKENGKETQREEAGNWGWGREMGEVKKTAMDSHFSGS